MGKLNELPSDCLQNTVYFLGLQESLKRLFFVNKQYRTLVQKQFHPRRTEITDKLGHLLRIATVRESSLTNFKNTLEDLLKSCKERNEDFTEVLNSTDNNPSKGYTALHLAVFKEKLAFTKYLLDQQCCRYDIPDQYGISVISNLCSQLQRRTIAIDSEIINIIVNSICRKYGYTIKGHFNGIVGIHCAISQAEQRKELLEKYLLKCYKDHKRIPYNTEELYPYTMKEEKENREAEARSFCWPLW